VEHKLFSSKGKLKPLDISLCYTDIPEIQFPEHFCHLA